MGYIYVCVPKKREKDGETITYKESRKQQEGLGKRERRKM